MSHPSTGALVWVPEKAKTDPRPTFEGETKGLCPPMDPWAPMRESHSPAAAHHRAMS